MQGSPDLTGSSVPLSYCPAAPSSVPLHHPGSAAVGAVMPRVVARLPAAVRLAPSLEAALHEPFRAGGELLRRRTAPPLAAKGLVESRPEPSARWRVWFGEGPSGSVCRTTGTRTSPPDHGGFVSPKSQLPLRRRRRHAVRRDAEGSRTHSSTGLGALAPRNRRPPSEAATKPPRI